MAKAQISLKSISQLLDETVMFYQAHWKTFIPILIIPIIPTLLTLFLGSRLNNQTMIIALGLLGLIINIWAGTAALYTVKKLVQKHAPITPQQAYTECIPYIIPLVLTQCIVGIIVMLGLFSRYITVFSIPSLLRLAVILLGLYIVIIGFAATFIVMFEDTYFLEAVKKSNGLVSGHFVAVALRLGVLILIVLLVEILFAIIGTGLAVHIGGLIRIIINALSNIVIVPFTLYYTYLVYQNLRDLKD